MVRGEDARDVTSCRGDYLGERVVCGENRDVSDDRARMLEDEPDGKGVGAGQGVVGDVVVGLERAAEDAGGGDDDTSVGGSDADASGRDSCVDVISGGLVLERASAGNGARSWVGSRRQTRGACSRVTRGRWAVKRRCSRQR